MTKTWCCAAWCVCSRTSRPWSRCGGLYARCYAHSADVGNCFVFASGNVEAARELIAAAVARVGAARTPQLIEKPTTREALTAAVLRAAAYTASSSGTFATTASANEA